MFTGRKNSFSRTFSTRVLRVSELALAVLSFSGSSMKKAG
jgi:hypothetical protein